MLLFHSLCLLLFTQTPPLPYPSIPPPLNPLVFLFSFMDIKFEGLEGRRHRGMEDSGLTEVRGAQDRTLMPAMEME